jgi:CheY-like chemotaxis protein
MPAKPAADAPSHNATTSHTVRFCNAGTRIDPLLGHIGRGQRSLSAALNLSRRRPIAAGVPESVNVRSDGEQGSGNAQAAALSGGARKRILVVEDNELNRDVLQRRLTAKGFEVRAAADGLQGLSDARSFSPDLILMDLGLPEIDGWECMRRLRADDTTRAIPIFVLTAHALVGDRERALAAGCDEFDTKPIDFARLLLKMQELLHRT